MMFNRSLMPRLAFRKRIRVEWPSVSSLQSQADTHRDRREWSDAASFYARAVALDPSRADLLVQRGNCLKESGACADAYQAYLDASRAGPDGEIELQLGHLLKLTGNLAGAGRAYERGAWLGNAFAAEELATLPTMLPQAMKRLAPRAGIEAADDVEAEADQAGLMRLVRLLSLCEHDPARTAPWHAAAHALQRHGFPDLARSMFELAFLWDGFSAAAVRRQGQVALGTGLWDGAATGAIRPGTDAVRALPSGTEQRLSGFVASVAESLPTGPGNDLLAGLRLTDVSEALPAAAVPATAQDLTRAADRVRRLFALLASGENGPSLRDLLDELTTIEPPPLIAFGTTAADVPLQVGRVLSNGLCRYLRHHHHAARGPVGSPAMFLAAARLGTGEQAQALPLHDGKSRSLGRIMARVGGGDAQDGDPLARLLLLVGRTLPAGHLTGLVEDLLDQDLTRAATLLVDDAALRDGLPLETWLPFGVMLKTAGLPRLALHLQRRLARLQPNRPDVLQELGIQEKIAGEFARAATAFRQALAIKPDDRFARGELLAILPEIEGLPEIAAEFGDDPDAEALLHEQLRFRLHLQPWLFADEPPGGSDQARLHDLAPELAPDFHLPVSCGDENRIEVRQVGWERRRGPDGEHPVLRGIEAIRATCFSTVPILRLRVRIDGRTIASLEAPGHPVEGGGPDVRKYVFNAWIDAAGLAPGPHELQLYFEDTSVACQSHTQMVLVDHPREADAFPLSDAVVVPRAGPDAGSVETRVAAMPSMARPANRSFFGKVPERVLVVRADQLGDFVASIPAIRRLRELLPQAELVALVTPPNEDLARSLGLFAEVVTVALAYDHATKQRFLSLARQVELRRTLTGMAFDLAIDLSPGSESRPLLRLSGAPHMVGFHPQHFPWLSFGIGAITRDPINGKERGAHALLILSLVEAMGAALRHVWTTIPAAHAPREALRRFGIGDGDRFVFLHAGARLRIKRWPIGHYLELAELIVTRTAMKAVVLSDEAEDASHPIASRIDPDRFSLTTGRVASEELEALIAHCAAFVGNDTGPKHLAALRGAKTVSLHMGQVNWDEWGQEGEGIILSRRAPCVGCGIEDWEDCGQDLACLTGIKPVEALQAIQALV